MAGKIDDFKNYNSHIKHAYFTWVMLDENYIAGALVLGSSLRFHSPGIRRVCVVAAGLEESSIKQLLLVFNNVCVVDLILAEAKHMQYGDRIQSFYSAWMNYCFTRLQCLRVGAKLGLEKILILDADCLAVGDLSSLFLLQPPAGILSLREQELLPDGQKFSHTEIHGIKLPQEMVNYAVQTNYGIRGSILLLRPSEEDFYKSLSILKSKPSNIPGAVGSYGDALLHIGPDERFFSEVFQDWYGWTHIHQRHMTTSWHEDRLTENEKPVAFHYVSQKPWNKFAGEFYDDFRVWYDELMHLLNAHPQLFNFFTNSFLEKSLLEKYRAKANSLSKNSSNNSRRNNFSQFLNQIGELTFLSSYDEAKIPQPFNDSVQSSPKQMTVHETESEEETQLELDCDNSKYEEAKKEEIKKEEAKKKEAKKAEVKKEEAKREEAKKEEAKKEETKKEEAKKKKAKKEEAKKKEIKKEEVKKEEAKREEAKKEEAKKKESKKEEVKKEEAKREEAKKEEAKKEETKKAEVKKEEAKREEAKKEEAKKEEAKKEEAKKEEAKKKEIKKEEVKKEEAQCEDFNGVEDLKLGLSPSSPSEHISSNLRWAEIVSDEESSDSTSEDTHYLELPIQQTQPKQDFRCQSQRKPFSQAQSRTAKSTPSRDNALRPSSRFRAGYKPFFQRHENKDIIPVSLSEPPSIKNLKIDDPADLPSPANSKASAVSESPFIPLGEIAASAEEVSRTYSEETYPFDKNCKTSMISFPKEVALSSRDLRVGNRSQLLFQKALKGLGTSAPRKS